MISIFLLSRLLSNTEDNYSTHLRFGWLHCLCLYLVTFHFAFLSGHLNFITNLGMYLGHLPLTHQNCWPRQPVCERNALVQFCRTESCLLPNYWSLKSRVSLARNSSQLDRQPWCVALAGTGRSALPVRRNGNHPQKPENVHPSTLLTA